MGTALSAAQCASRYPALQEINCSSGSVVFGRFVSNAAITGIGTDLSFVLTAGLSLLVCLLVQIICDRLRHHKWRLFFEPVIVSFSDQQIVRGISISIATLYTSSACTIDAYRYNMICYYLLMTIVSHLSSVLALRSYATVNKVLAVTRFLLIFCQVFFAGQVFSNRLTETFPTGIPNASITGNTTLVLPAVCFQLVDAKPYTGLEDLGKPTKDIGGFSAYIIIATFYVVSTVFTLAHILTLRFSPGTAKQVRDQEDRAKRWTWFWWLGLLRFLILIAAWIIWAWSVANLYKFRAWMNDSGWLGEQGLLAENSWTFGQLLSILMMAGAPLSVLNAWSGYRDTVDDDKSRRPLRSGFNQLPPAYDENDYEM